MNKVIRLELSDWLYNVGIVGIANILAADGIEVDKGINYIEIYEDMLEGFEEKYFKYFINEYETTTSWHKLLGYETVLDGFEKDKLTEKLLDKLNGIIEDVKKKLTSNSYSSAYLLFGETTYDFIKEERTLQKIKLSKKQSIEDAYEPACIQIDKLKEIISHLRKKEVKRYIAAKNIIYDLIQSFWSDVSFLNKNNSKNNMYTEYEEYFIKPVLNYISDENVSGKYKCFSCGNEITKLGKPNSYDLTWLSKVGVDAARKSSHYWNYISDSNICPICNLVYSCIPAGFSILKGKGIFINENSSVSNLIEVNKLPVNQCGSYEELEELGYFNIIDILDRKQFDFSDKEIENIQIVKFDSNNERRPYTFNLLSKPKLQLMYQNRKKLKLLIKVYVKLGKNYYLNLYREVIQRLYSSKNQFDLINMLFVLHLQDNYSAIYCIDAILKINHDATMGRKGYKMGYYKEIEDFKKAGKNLRKEYEGKNKLPGITYRLVNALKTKNTPKFLDTLLNAYMYIGKPIPQDFANVLNDEERFQTIGYAFLIGLNGDETKVNQIEDEVEKQ